MVQLYSSSKSYPPGSIVDHQNQLWVASRVVSAGEQRQPPNSPWTSLQVNSDGIPFLGPRSSSTVTSPSLPQSIFDTNDEFEEVSAPSISRFDSFSSMGEEEGWNSIGKRLSEDINSTTLPPTSPPLGATAAGLSSTFSSPSITINTLHSTEEEGSEHPPTPPPKSIYSEENTPVEYELELKDSDAYIHCTTAVGRVPLPIARDHLLVESRLEKDFNYLISELLGQVVYKNGGRGVWSFSPEDAELEKTKSEALINVLGLSDMMESNFRSRERWLLSAEARTEYYSLPSAIYPTARWVLVKEGEPIPADALPLGEERDGDGQWMHACRGYWAGGLQVGKAGQHLGLKRHSFSYAGRETYFPDNTFEVLCGSPLDVEWLTISPSSKINPLAPDGVKGWRQPVEGGREADGRFLAIGRSIMKGGHHPGKIHLSPLESTIAIPYGGKEHHVTGYQLLVYI